MIRFKEYGSWTICLIGAFSLCASGCQTANHAQDGALVGAGLGTAAGAIIGHQSGRTGNGAIVGALAGAVAGSLVGDAQDAREQRDAAIAQSRYQQEAAQYHATKVAVTNYDLIDMADAHLSEQVILNAVQTRGGQFDLSPSGIIELKRHGVSDNVILSLQQTTGRPAASRPAYATHYAYPSTTYAYPPPPVYHVAPRPATVGIIVAPRPYIGFGYHSRYRGPHHHHHHHHH